MAKGQIKHAQVKVDKKEFEKLCELQCTLTEIAGVFDVSIDTIERWCKNTYGKNFAEVFKIKSANGKVSLRRNMFKQAEKNPTMAIWLSKNHLGMQETIAVENKQLEKVEELLNKIENEASK